MQAPKNRRVVVLGYAVATALGNTFASTWQGAVAGRAGFRRLSRCQVETRSNVVGEIPGWEPEKLPGVSAKEASVWNAGYVFLTVEMCRQALADAGLVMDAATGPRTACLIGSALNGSDAYRIAMDNYLQHGPLKVSPYLLPNLCANLPAGKAGMELGFTGPIISPQGACASGNHAIGLASRMIRDGDAELLFCSFAAFLVFIRFSIGRSYLNGKGSLRLIGKGLYGNVKIQCYRTFFMDLCYVNRFNTALFHAD